MKKTEKKRQKKPLLKRIWKYKAVYLLMVPAFIWFLVFCYYPMYGALIAFKDFRFSKGILGSEWVGLKWFSKFMVDSAFWRCVLNTLKISLLKLVFCFPAPIILALMLNAVRSERYKRIIQTITYMPHFVSWVVVGAMMTKLFSPYGGLVNTLRSSIDSSAQSIFYMGESDFFYPMILISDIWKEVGWGTIIYLAAISGIDPNLYEAAAIDGAHPMQMMRHITLPMIYPTICIMLIMGMGNILNVGYEQLLQLQTTATQQLAEVIDTYVIRKGLTGGSYSYSAAIGLMKSGISLILVASANRISRRLSDISLW